MASPLVNPSPLLPQGAVPAEVQSLARFDQELISNLFRELSQHAIAINLLFSHIRTYTVATLPTGIAGDIAYATNCRVFNGAGVQEGAGAGTGGLVTHNGTAWKIVGTNVTAVA